MNIDQLGKIQKVDAPPYLFTRIQQRIRDTQKEVVSPFLVWSVGLSFMLIVGLNLGVAFSPGSSESTTSALVLEMNISSVNDLYK